MPILPDDRAQQASKRQIIYHSCMHYHLAELWYTSMNPQSFTNSPVNYRRNAD